MNGYLKIVNILIAKGGAINGMGVKRNRRKYESFNRTG